MALGTQEAVQLHQQLVESLRELNFEAGEGDIWPIDGLEPGSSLLEPPVGHPDVIDGDIVADIVAELSEEEISELSEEDMDALRAFTAELEEEREALAWYGGTSASADSRAFDNVREVVYTDDAEEASQNGSKNMANLIEQSSTNGSSSSSSSTTTKKPELKALDRQQVEGLLSAIDAARLGIDAQARKTSADPLEQARLVKQLKGEYDQQERTLRSILARIEQAEDDGLEENHAKNYGLYTVDGNYRLSQRLEEVIRQTQHKMDEARDEAAVAIRECEAELAEEHPEVYSVEVRDLIYAELVKQGVLAPYAPMEI